MGEIGAFDSVHWHMEELASRIVAKTGIPSDRFNLGKLIMQSLQDAPEFILQIDGALDKSETFREALKRTIQCAIALERLGVKRGDVVVLLAPIHLHLTIPYYAALYLGAAISPVDTSVAVRELEGMFLVTRPKVIFCQNDKLRAIQQALKQVNLQPHIVTFDERCLQLLRFHGCKPADFDPEDTLALITFTSGTIGLPNAAALSHQNLTISLPSLWLSFVKFPTPTENILIASPLQWVSASFNFLFSPILRVSRLQSSAGVSLDKMWFLIEEYKPTYMVVSPTMMIALLKSRGERDMSCFKNIFLGGSFVTQQLIDDVQRTTPTSKVGLLYGLSEISGMAFNRIAHVAGSVGYPIGTLHYRLVNLESNKVIEEPNVSGELWLKGPTVIKVSPLELEAVIRRHPGVYDVAVTGIPDPDCGDLPVACVVRRTGSDVSAQEIKLLIKETLSDAKQLRGGVVFMAELPTTISTKVHRKKLQDMVLKLHRE